MDAEAALAWLARWQGPLAPVLAMAGAGVAWLAGNRTARHRLRIDERTQETNAGAAVTARSIALVDQLQEELTRSRAWLDQTQAELVALRTARIDLEERMGQIYVNYLTARTMLHELQRRLDIPETVFAPEPAMLPAARAVAATRATGPPAA